MFPVQNHKGVNLGFIKFQKKHKRPFVLDCLCFILHVALHSFHIRQQVPLLTSSSCLAIFILLI